MLQPTGWKCELSWWCLPSPASVPPVLQLPSLLWVSQLLPWLGAAAGAQEAVSSDSLIGAVNAPVSLLVSMKSRQVPREEHLSVAATWLGRCLALIPTAGLPDLYSSTEW